MTYRTSDEWESFLGEQIQAIRLRKNLSQQEVANRAEISLRTLARLEAGHGSSLSAFVKVLSVLGEEVYLQSLAPDVSVSPLQMMRLGQARLRASARRGTFGERE